MMDEPDEPDYCPTCESFAYHDPGACEREDERAQVEHALGGALAILEGASSWLAHDQPLHMADWDLDTREANHILLSAWAQVSREYRRL
jgi:hypothetical protein